MPNLFAQVLDLQRVPGRKPLLCNWHSSAAGAGKSAVPSVSAALQTLVGLQTPSQLKLDSAGQDVARLSETCIILAVIRLD